MAKVMARFHCFFKSSLRMAGTADSKTFNSWIMMMLALQKESMRGTKEFHELGLKVTMCIPEAILLKRPPRL